MALFLPEGALESIARDSGSKSNQWDRAFDHHGSAAEGSSEQPTSTFVGLADLVPYEVSGAPPSTLFR